MPLARLATFPGIGESGATALAAAAELIRRAG